MYNLRMNLKLLLTKIEYLFLRPILGKEVLGESCDIYGSRMLYKKNLLHRLIFKWFYKRVSVDESIKEIKESIEWGVPIYVSTGIGQVEYNSLNHIFINEGLPLAWYTNGISSRFWMPCKLARASKLARLKERMNHGGNLPHPVSSGYIEKLVDSGKAILVRLKSTKLYNDLYWDAPDEDIILKLISLVKKGGSNLYIVPLQFIWDSGSRRYKRPILDLLFGETEEPCLTKRAILFLKRYRERAIVHFCKPLRLKDFIDTHQGLDGEEAAMLLKDTILRQISEEKKSIIGPAFKPRKRMMEEVLSSSAIEEAIHTTANETKKDPEDLRILARKYVDEMAADIKYVYIEYGHKLLSWIFNSMYDGIWYNEDMLSKIKQLLPRYPVVFIPNHRSHIDYLALSNILYTNGLSVPHVAAGINLSFWPLGAIFRRCGAFFIRRKFPKNEIYKKVFESYLRTLIKEGYSIEFFIEGGRTRTGRLREPKLGMLGAIVRAMLDNVNRDLYIVPTSITYDKVVEEDAYLKEIKGEEKKKEGLLDLIKLRRYLARRYGKIYVNFGEPLSLRTFMEKCVSGEVKAPSNEETEEMRPEEGITKCMARAIMSELGSGCFVTSYALTATALLMHDKKGIIESECKYNARLLIDYLNYAGARLSHPLIEDPEGSIEDALAKFASSGDIAVYTNFTPPYYLINDDKRWRIDFQKGTILHLLLPIGALSHLLIRSTEKGRAFVEEKELEEGVEGFRTIFAAEFAAIEDILSQRNIQLAVDFLKRQGVVSVDGTRIFVSQAVSIKALKRYSLTLEHLLESYTTCLQTIELLGDEECSEKELVQWIQETGGHLLNLGIIDRLESISKPTYENGIRLCTRLGILTESTDEKGTKKYTISNKKLLDQLKQKLEIL